MKQRDIVLAQLDQINPQELTPVVIVSGPSMNMHAQISLVCPLNPTIRSLASCIVIHPSASTGLTQPAEILTFHIRPLPHSRLGKTLGEISPQEMQQILSGLYDILTY